MIHPGRQIAALENMSESRVAKAKYVMQHQDVMACNHAYKWTRCACRSNGQLELKVDRKDLLARELERLNLKPSIEDDGRHQL